MFNRKILISEIEKRFAQMMSVHQFNKKFVRQKLKRKTDFGHHCIQFIYKKYYDSIEILVNVGIRYDNVIKYMASILEKPGYFKDSGDNAVLGHYIDVFSNKTVCWEIKSEKDIDLVLQEVYDDVIKYGFPFFDKYSDINEVYAYSLDDSKPLRLMPMDEYRAIKSIAISKLYNIGDINQLISDRRNYLNSMQLDKNTKDLSLRIFEYFVSRIM